MCVCVCVCMYILNSLSYISDDKTVDVATVVSFLNYKDIISCIYNILHVISYIMVLIKLQTHFTNIHIFLFYDIVNKITCRQRFSFVFPFQPTIHYSSSNSATIVLAVTFPCALIIGLLWCYGLSWCFGLTSDKYRRKKTLNSSEMQQPRFVADDSDSLYSKASSLSENEIEIANEIGYVSD